ncbi:MAG: hypothetical protein R3C05_02835 [Pirellulaceae bacterium]
MWIEATLNELIQNVIGWVYREIHCSLANRGLVRTCEGDGRSIRSATVPVESLAGDRRAT